MKGNSEDNKEIVSTSDPLYNKVFGVLTRQINHRVSSLLPSMVKSIPLADMTREVTEQLMNRIWGDESLLSVIRQAVGQEGILHHLLDSSVSAAITTLKKPLKMMSLPLDKLTELPFSLPKALMVRQAFDVLQSVKQKISPNDLIKLGSSLAEDGKEKIENLIDDARKNVVKKSIELVVSLKKEVKSHLPGKSTNQLQALIKAGMKQAAKDRGIFFEVDLKKLNDAVGTAFYGKKKSSKRPLQKINFRDLASDLLSKKPDDPRLKDYAGFFECWYNVLLKAFRTASITKTNETGKYHFISYVEDIESIRQDDETLYHDVRQMYVNAIAGVLQSILSAGLQLITDKKTKSKSKKGKQASNEDNPFIELLAPLLAKKTSSLDIKARDRFESIIIQTIQDQLSQSLMNSELLRNHDGSICKFEYLKRLVRRGDYNLLRGLYGAGAFVNLSLKAKRVPLWQEAIEADQSFELSYNESLSFFIRYVLAQDCLSTLAESLKSIEVNQKAVDLLDDLMVPLSQVTISNDVLATFRQCIVLPYLNLIYRKTYKKQTSKKKQAGKAPVLLKERGSG